MLIPPPVRTPVIAWLVAVGAGVAETSVHLAQPDPPGPGAVLTRGGIYLAVVVLRATHVVAVGTAVVLMFRPPAHAFFRHSEQRDARLPTSSG
jgi:hypothetical protein